MSKSRNLADLLDANGDVKTASLDNAAASDAGLSYLSGLNFTDEASFKAGVNLEVGTDVLAPNGDGSGLSGIASDALSSTFNIRSGQSLGAGKAVSYAKSDNTVGKYPSNPSITEGTAASLSRTYSYTDRSGSTAMTFVTDSGSGSATFYSAYKSGGVWVDGSSTTQTRGYAAIAYGCTASVRPLPGADNAYMLYVYAGSQTGSGGYETSYNRSSYGIATVNPSNGAISVSWTNWDDSRGNNPPGRGGGFGSYVTHQNPAIFYAYTYLQGRGYAYRTFKIDGTSLSYTTTGPSNMSSGNSTNFTYHKNQFYSASTLATLNSGDFSYRDVSWDGSSILTDMGSTTSADPTNITTRYDFIFSKDGTYAIQLYKYINTYYVRTLTTSFSSGVLTLTEAAITEIPSSITSSFDPTAVYSITDTKCIIRGAYGGVSKFVTFEIETDGTLKGFSASAIQWDLPSTNNMAFFTIGADESTVYVENNDSARRIDTLSLDAYYEADPFTYVGFSESNQTGSTATVVTKGVASGFTGLTTGAKYYLTNAQDGTITTDTTQGEEVGVALSATELLVK